MDEPTGVIEDFLNKLRFESLNSIVNDPVYFLSLYKGHDGWHNFIRLFELTNGFQLKEKDLSNGNQCI